MTVLYKIGDVARILGISPDLIRYYEEKGVVSPAKDPTNNYRYYDTWDINYLIDCLWYKNFGFGIEQIARMASEYSFDNLLSCLEGKSGELLTAIRRQELLLQRIRRYSERLNVTKSNIGVCSTRTCAEFIKYINRHDDTYDKEAAVHDLSRRWLEYMPFTRRYFEIPKDCFEGGLDRHSWGFSLGMQYVKEFNISIKPPIEHMAPRLCIHTAFKSAGKDKFTARHIDFMLDYAIQHNLTPSGSAFGNLACSVIENNEPTGYFEVFLPVTQLGAPLGALPQDPANFFEKKLDKKL